MPYNTEELHKLITSAPSMYVYTDFDKSGCAEADDYHVKKLTVAVECSWCELIIQAGEYASMYIDDRNEAYDICCIHCEERNHREDETWITAGLKTWKRTERLEKIKQGERTCNQ